MNIEQFLKEGRLKRHKTSSAEISELLRVVKRDIADAKATAISNDRRFATAYNAVLQLAAIVLACRGLRAAGWMHHYTTFEALYEILGAKHESRLVYFDQCRTKRNVADYTRAGDVNEHEVEELIFEAEEFLRIVLGWLKLSYPKYLPNDNS